MLGGRLLLLLLLVGATACGPEDPGPFGELDLAHQQNHPNALVASKLAQQPVSYPFSFVLLSDTHVPYGKKTFAALREQILQLDPPPVFVAVIGDLVDSGKMPEHLEYLSYVDPFPIPVISLIGNHEMYPGQRKNYEAVYGPENFSFEFGNLRFVALNDIIPRRNGLTDLQVTFLEQKLADPKYPDKFVLMHAPPPAMPPPWGAPPFFNAGALYDLTERYGVRAVVTGHVHEFRHHLINGVHYFIVGGAGGPQAEHLEDPPQQGIFHFFLHVTVEATGKSRAELVKLGELAVPDPNYTIPLETQPAK